MGDAPDEQPVAVKLKDLSKFVAEGNSVLACFDEGSGKEEDLVGMMSLSSGVIKMEMQEEKTVLNVVKHPKLKSKRIEVAVADGGKRELWDPNFFDQEMCRSWWETTEGQLYIWYIDADTKQWVQAVPASGGGGGGSADVSSSNGG